MIQSSANPISAAPTMAYITRAPDREKVTPGMKWADRNPTTTAPTMQIPPMVGVPALAMWTWGPSSRIC